MLAPEGIVQRITAWRKPSEKYHEGFALTVEKPRRTGSTNRCVSALFISCLLASCSSTVNDPSMALAVNPQIDSGPSYAAATPASAENASFSNQSTEESQVASLEGPADGVPLPSEVAYAPNSNPSSVAEIVAQAPAAAVNSNAEAPAVSLANAQLTIPAPDRFGNAASTKSPRALPTSQRAMTEPVVAQRAPDANDPDAVIQTAFASPNQPASAPAPVQATAQAPEAQIAPTQVALAQPAQAQTKKRGLLSSLFSSQNETNAHNPARRVTSDAIPSAKQNLTSPVISRDPGKPLVQLASVGGVGVPSGQQATSSNSALPGVRTEGLFEITRKSGLNDDSDVDLHEGEEPAPVRVASAAGMARLAPNGLMTQTENVEISCLKPSLVRVLKTIENHYGQKIVVTSGYRNPTHNQRAKGARNSLHMFCAAADIQIEGVTKWELANYVRTMPGRGGVGTYCHTESVHVDVGPERDWNWRCGKRK